jgi:parvulin-like peptidyl-prolyl isomerase
MRSILFVLVASAGVALAPWGARSAEPEIVARVNGEPVTRGELERALADPLARLQLEQELDAQDSDSKGLERLALQKLIQRLLFLQEAGRRSFTVTEEDLDQALTTLRRRFTDLQSFGTWMKERGLDDGSLLDTVRAQVLMTRVWAALVKDVRPTEKEVQAYYEAHKEDLMIGEEVRLRFIAVTSKPAAEEIMAALLKGESFSRLAQTRSLGTRAAQGGDTGWVNSQTLPPPLQRAVDRLEVGDAAGPLEKGADEFLIVGLEGRRPVRAKSLAEARPEIERRLLVARRQEAVEAWLAEQEEKSKIEVFLSAE